MSKAQVEKKTALGVCKYLESYKGSHPFLNSLQEQLKNIGSLTERQVAAAEKFMTKDKTVSNPWVGGVIEIKAWLARAISKEKNIQMFRNIEVRQVLRESERAILVRAKLSAKPAVNCHICGRALDDEKSIATGIGPTCAKKIGVTRELDKYELLKVIEDLVEKTGIIELWIPKSQIKGAGE